MSQIYVPPRIIYNREDGTRDIFVSQEKLGHGGFAVVYRVLHQNTNKTYAMKVISKDGSTSSKGKVFLEKLKNEIQIQKTLDHPNIVRSRLSFSDDKNHYIILEYCPGKSIREYLRKCEQRRIPEPEVRKILNDVIQGLIYLHNHQIIHHDLKLENFLIGSDGKVKIADFGISSILKDEDEKNYSISGTINYMSPEILQKENKGHGFEVDIWALGVAAFIMLTGRPPFDGIDKEVIYEKIRKGDYRFPTAFQLSYEAKEFIKSTLKIDPRKRPTAIDLLTHPFLIKFGKEQVQLYKPPSNLPWNNYNFNLNLNAGSNPSAQVPIQSSGSFSARSYRENQNKNFNFQMSDEPLNSIQRINVNSGSNYSNIRNVSTPSRSVSSNVGSYNSRNQNNVSSQISEDSLNSIKNLNLNANIPCASPGNMNLDLALRTIGSPTRIQASGSHSARNYREATRNRFNSNLPSKNYDFPAAAVPASSGSFSARLSSNRPYNMGSQISDEPPSTLKKFNSNPISTFSNENSNFQHRNFSPTTTSGGSRNVSLTPNRNVSPTANRPSSLLLNRRFSTPHARGSSISSKVTSSSSASASSAANGSFFSIPSYFVAKYLFHKQDLGYLLGNGTVGVCFDDKSRIVLDPKEDFVQFYKNYNSLAECVMLNDTLDLVDEESENLKDRIRKKIALVQKFARSLKKYQSLFDTPDEEFDPSVPIYHVKYFLKKDDAVLFRLNDRNIQVNFGDHQKLIIFWNTKKMCLTRSLKDKCALLDIKNVVGMSPESEELRKYRNAKELLAAMSQK